jgi:transposase
VTRDWRDDRIDELERQLHERGRVIEEQSLQVAALLARVAKLEDRLKTSSRNSSKPPSSDPPWMAPPKSKPSSGRKPGG